MQAFVIKSPVCILQIISKETGFVRIVFIVGLLIYILHSFNYSYFVSLRILFIPFIVCSKWISYITISLHTDLKRKISIFKILSSDC